MKNFKNWLYFLVFPLLWFCCQTKNELEAIHDFFAKNPKYADGNYMRHLNYKHLDSLLLQIRQEVPSKWTGHAIESAFYHLPESPKDSLSVIFLNKVEATIKHDSVQAFVELLRGHIFLRLSQYDSAEVCLNKCYQLSMKGNRMTRAYDAEFERSLILMRRHFLAESLELMTRTYNYFSSLNPDGGRVMENLYTLSSINYSIGNYRQALYWLQKIDEYMNEPRQKRIKAIYARTYMKLGLLDSAKLMIDSCEIDKNIVNRSVGYEFGYYCGIRGEIKRLCGDCEAAKADFFMALQDSLYFGRPVERTRFHKGLAESYLCQGQLDSALFYCQKALITADSSAITNVYQLMADVYSRQKKTEKALAAERQSRKINDEYLAHRRSSLMAYVSGRHQIEQQWQEEAHAQQRQKLWLVVSLLTAALALGISLFLLFRARQQRHILAHKQALAEAETQLKTQQLQQAEQTISQKDQELEASNQLVAFKNELIQALEMHLDKNKKELSEAPENETDNATAESELKESLTEMRLLTKQDWIKFKELFEQRYPTYEIELKQKKLNMTSTDIRLVILVKIGFSNREMAEMLGVSLTSIYTSRYRLRKKLGLTEETDLDDWILK